jgi:hypothetical protein
VHFPFKTQSLRWFLLLPALTVITAGVASAPALPNPVLYFMSAETVQQNGKSFVRYHYDVFNKDKYPADMFAPAPSLPPCGANTKSSRTWVDVYEERGKRLYGFCALTKPQDLNQIYFQIEDGASPPSWIYIEMTDRQTNTKYKSNLAETSN